MKKYDVIVIGAGPAGLTSAMYASRANLRTIILDKGLYGGQINNTADIENYPAFKNIFGSKLSKLMYSSAIRFGAKYKYGAVKIIKYNPKTTIKTVYTTMGTYQAPVVIIATGANPRHLNIKGEKEYAGKGVSYCAVCDGNFFKNEPVVVIGGGDSAFSEAEYLSHIVSKITILIRKPFAQAEPEEIKKARHNTKINILYNCKAININGNKEGVTGITLFNNKSLTKNKLKTSAVFIYIGMIPNTKMFHNLPILTKTGWVKSNSQMETAIKGLYAIGDVRNHQLRQIVTAVGDGGIAGHNAYKFIQK